MLCLHLPPPLGSAARCRSGQFVNRCRTCQKDGSLQSLFLFHGRIEPLFMLAWTSVMALILDMHRALRLARLDVVAPDWQCVCVAWVCVRVHMCACVGARVCGRACVCVQHSARVPMLSSPGRC